MKYQPANGPIYQAGTLSGNPVAMAAGLATLEIVSQPNFFDALGATTADLARQLRRVVSSAHGPAEIAATIEAARKVFATL